MTDEYSDDEQINENELSPTERRRQKAARVLKRVVEEIYGYERGTYPEQVYNQLHECIRLIGERLEQHKPKKGKFHAIFYMCYESDIGMPQTPNTAYTVLTTIFRALHAIDKKNITLDETFIKKNGYQNTDYFFVGAPYKLPKYISQRQLASEGYHDWFDNTPLNKILERFIDLMREDKTDIDNEQSDSPLRTSNSSKVSSVEKTVSSKDSNPTDSENIQEIKNDIETLKQIKNDATTDEATREATESTIKALKEKKKSIKHGKRRLRATANKPKTELTPDAQRDELARDVELIVKNEPSTKESDETEKASERLTEKRRKRLLAEVLRRMTEQLKAQRGIRRYVPQIDKQNAENEVLQNKQMKSTTSTSATPDSSLRTSNSSRVSNSRIERIKRMFKIDDDEDAEVLIKVLDKKHALQKELKALTKDPNADPTQIQALKDKIKSAERIIYKIANRANGINEKERAENMELKKSVFKALFDNANKEAEALLKAKDKKQALEQELNELTTNNSNADPAQIQALKDKIESIERIIYNLKSKSQDYAHKKREEDKIKELEKSTFRALFDNANKDVIDLRKEPSTLKSRYISNEDEIEPYRQEFKRQADAIIKEYNDIINERVDSLLQRQTDIINSDEIDYEEKYAEEKKERDKLYELSDEIYATEKAAKQELKLLYERLPVHGRLIFKVYQDAVYNDLFKAWKVVENLKHQFDNIYAQLSKRQFEEAFDNLLNADESDEYDIIDENDVEMITYDDTGTNETPKKQLDKSNKLMFEQKKEEKEIKPLTVENIKASEKTNSTSSSSSSSKQPPKRRGKRRNPPKIDIDVNVPNEIKTTYDARRKIATIKPVFKAKLTF